MSIVLLLSAICIIAFCIYAIYKPNTSSSTQTKTMETALKQTPDTIHNIILPMYQNILGSPDITAIIKNLKTLPGNPYLSEKSVDIFKAFLTHLPFETADQFDKMRFPRLLFVQERFTIGQYSETEATEDTPISTTTQSIIDKTPITTALVDYFSSTFKNKTPDTLHGLINLFNPARTLAHELSLHLNCPIDTKLINHIQNSKTFKSSQLAPSFNSFLHSVEDKMSLKKLEKSV